MPVNTASGRLSSHPNQTTSFFPPGSVSYSLKLENGATQRFTGPSQRRQCGEAVFGQRGSPIVYRETPKTM